MASRVRSTVLRGPRRRRSAVAAPEGMEPQYRRYRAAILLMLLLLVFSMLWVVNAEWTTQYLMANLAVSLGTAWAVHLVVSSTELAGPILRPYFVGFPPWVPMLVIILSLPFGVLDVLSSAIGITPYLAWSGMQGIDFDSLRTLGGLVVAFLPERMIMYTFLALMKVVRS